ncbi:PAS domain S-box protein [uncultured Sphingomonas sp.]|uniref:PAS domain S-box protein n=1 Tax=uncultured Sphingomonas sp. TaxID=158754 RepID=UPI0035CC332B
MIYNDAYSAFAGTRHPRLLGSKVREGWPEVADFNDNVMKVVLAGGTLAYRDQELVLDRSGRPEPTWMDLDYSPVLGEDGWPGGVICIVNETTARVLAERRATEEREQQAQMFEQAPTFMALLRGPEYRFELANPGYVELAGNRPLLGRTFAEALPDAVAQGFLALLDRVFATGEPYVADGAVYWEQAVADRPPRERIVDFVYQPIKDASGRVTAIFCEGADVTARVKAASALRASDERLRLVIESARDHAILTTDARGMITSWSAGAEAVFGWTEDEAVGRPAGIIFTPEDRAAGVDGLELEAAARDGFANDERWHVRKDGGRVFMNGSIRPLPSGREGDAQGFIKIARDETGRRRTDEALRALNADLERQVLERTRERGTIWQVTPDLLGVLNTDAIFEQSNPAWLTVLGLPEAEVARTPIFEFIHPDDLPKTYAALEEVKAGQPVLRFENRYKSRLDGAYRWLSWVVVPIDDKFYASARDITAEKDQEQALARAQEALRQSQKMEAIGQLTGGIAHDFNNLLAGISGSLEILAMRLSQGRTGEVGRYIEGAQASAKRAAALTQRLLAFSRRQTLDPKPVDVNKLIAGMEDLIRRSIGPDVELEVVGAGGLWLTRIDASQLENALLNLAINARDAMPEGGRITIETANKWLDDRASRERELPPGQYLSVCVTDTGTGMTPEVIARAFDPFFTTKPIGQGTGLGLSMIHGFVRQSGGQVRIYSEEGKGTTMCLYLPRFVGALDAFSESDPETAAEGSHEETVLVIDDEPTVRMLIVEVLEEAGYQALEAEDGAAGLKFLQGGGRIDLLITDVGLPGGMNGRQVADAARIARPDLKVLFVTGYAENAAVGNGHLEPGMQVITKPFVMTELATKIRDMIDGDVR